mmetsp:Transcript_946/g.2019  ORF Transcript_946/g.2019 Transcript_946/m.2019 type:complete len:136 (+) Transcript_946:85-492(+)
MNSFPVFLMMLVAMTTLSVNAMTPPPANGVDTCIPEHCVCIGDCPSSYEDQFSSLTSIFNGDQNICYGTNGLKFGIGGNEITIGDETVTTSDLGPCPGTIPKKTVAAIEGVSSASSVSLSALTAATIGGVVWAFV